MLDMVQEIDSTKEASGGLSRTSKRRMRIRAAIACDTCRNRKVKCNGAFPCSTCIRHTFECSYKEKQSSNPYSTVERASISHLPESCHTKSRQNYTNSASGREERIAGSTLTRISRLSTSTTPATSPNGSDSIQASPSFNIPTTPLHNDSEKLSRPSLQSNAGGLGEFNKHTKGAEFYGPTGTFYFLSRLRSRANARQRQDQQRYMAPKHTHDTCVVDLMHSSDYSIYSDTIRSERHPSTSPARTREQSQPAHSQQAHPYKIAMGLEEIEIEVEKECARLYFQNLHCIHPILEQSSFMIRCENKVWKNKVTRQSTSSVHRRTKDRFSALFNAVLAVGAITAGETSMLMWDRTILFLNEVEQQEGICSKSPLPYPPIRAARLFFERSKSCLEDIYESSSLETVQTLSLLSVFCQNALKPHSCYMYSGIAIRTAFAMGIPARATLNDESKNERILWWTLYVHEIEMCSSAGRQSFLQEPERYAIPFPCSSASECPSPNIINYMVELARIMDRAVANASQVGIDGGLTGMVGRAQQFEQDLLEWKFCLPSTLDFDIAPIGESEFVTKQKIVLKLRFLNTRILIHRPFLVFEAAKQESKTFSNHIISCVTAAKDTIRVVHETYLFRPYFRTWWYNCTYVLDASMVLLYVVLTYPGYYPCDNIFEVLNQSLEIFDCMKQLSVARKCAEITKEVIHAARTAHEEHHAQCNTLMGLETMSTTEYHAPHSVLSFTTSNTAEGGETEAANLIDRGLDENIYAGLIDPSLIAYFIGFDDPNLWAIT
ncbi:fungal-specific transcription factor domain-containing protein [Camillea tinctor]|nr:fungal-specific transcription factor domain-containing protein [Camillea tinctor]